MSRIRVKYAIKGESENYLITVSDSCTFLDLLKLVNERRKKNCNQVFLDDSMIDNEEKVSDYADDDSIFILNNNLGKIPLPMLASPGKFHFFVTGNDQTLLSGIDVNLEMNMNPAECCESLLTQLESNNVNIQNKKLLIYLAGGVPFNNGTLKDIYSNNEIEDINFSIYGVLINRIDQKILDKTYDELCNVNSNDMKILISPLSKSTKKGLCDMACFLGYLNRNGPQSDLFLRASTLLIKFPPLITTLKKLIEQKSLNGKEIVTITSTLFTFFRYLMPLTINDENILEYGLRCCNIICNICKIPEAIPILEIENNIETVQTNDDPIHNLRNAILLLNPNNDSNKIYFWKGDVGENFDYREIDKPDPKEIEYADKTFKTFSPVAPLSLKSANNICIINGKYHSFLFLSASCDCGSNSITIIDPTIGCSKSVMPESFAAEQKRSYNDVANLIDADQVKQIIFVCFDTSNSMNSDLEGKNFICPEDIKEYPRLSDVSTRMTVATQYLTTFANMAYGFNIPCIQGLISFNTKCKIMCPLSPLVPDFENKGLKDLTADGWTHLWDAISLACDEISHFTINQKGEQIYKNASKRILVISDGEDYASSIKVEDVAKKLVQNNITVDCVIVTLDDSCKMLATLCHLTGGMAFRPKTTNEGLSLFEKRAFLNIEDRETSDNPIIPGNENSNPSYFKSNIEKITLDIMNEAVSHVTYDDYPKYKYEKTNIDSLSTPLHLCYIHRDNQMNSTRERRIMKELRIAARIMDNNSKNYDPDLKIYPFESKIDH